MLPVQVHNLPLPSLEHIQEYQALGEAVPPVLLEKAIAPRTTDDTTLLAQNYLGEDRVGPANVHNNDPDGLVARAVAGVDAEPPVPIHMQGPAPNKTATHGASKNRICISISSIALFSGMQKHSIQIVCKRVMLSIVKLQLYLIPVACR